MAQEPLPQTPSEGRAVAALHSNERMAFLATGSLPLPLLY
jgi:hypothetical protein